MACQVGGQAELWIEEERAILTAGQSMIVPAGHRHGFRNNGETTLHIEAVLAGPLVGPVTQLDRSSRQVPQPGSIKAQERLAGSGSQVGRSGAEPVFSGKGSYGTPGTYAGGQPSSQNQTFPKAGQFHCPTRPPATSVTLDSARIPPPWSGAGRGLPKLGGNAAQRMLEGS
jgi:hypothetical protein